MINELGHVPTENESKKVIYKNITFVIEGIDDNWIETVLITKNNDKEVEKQEPNE